MNFKTGDRVFWNTSIKKDPIHGVVIDVGIDLVRVLWDDNNEVVYDVHQKNSDGDFMIKLTLQQTRENTLNELGI